MDSALLKKLEKSAGITLGKTERERFLKNSELNIDVLERAGRVRAGNTEPYSKSTDNYGNLRDDVPKHTGFNVKKIVKPKE